MIRITEQQLKNALSLIKDSNVNQERLNNKLFELYRKDLQNGISYDDSLAYLLILEANYDLKEDFIETHADAEEVLGSKTINNTIQQVIMETIEKCSDENFDDFGKIIKSAVLNELETQYSIKQYEQDIAKKIHYNSGAAVQPDVAEFSKRIKEDRTLMLECFCFLTPNQQRVVSDYFGIVDNLPKSFDEIYQLRNISKGDAVKLLKSGINRLYVALLPPEDLTEDQNQLRNLVYSRTYDVIAEIEQLAKHSNDLNQD